MGASVLLLVAIVQYCVTSVMDDPFRVVKFENKNFFLSDIQHRMFSPIERTIVIWYKPFLVSNTIYYYFHYLY